AAYFAPELPHLAWQPSDVAENLPSVRLWREEAQTPRLLEPLELDVEQPFPKVPADEVFSGNTSHIMSWPQVEKLFAGVASLLPPRGVFALYGPFNYGGRHTAPCNARFDVWLRRGDPRRAWRNVEGICGLAARHGLAFDEDNAM